MLTGRYFTTQPAPQGLLVELPQPVGSLADTQVMEELDAVVAQLRGLPRAADGAAPQVVVDFRQMPYFGSSLLEALRILWVALEDQQGRMALCNVSGLGREILALAKFDQLWPVQDTAPLAWRELARLTSTAGLPLDLQELLRDYAAGPEALRQALAGLSDEQVRRRVAPGRWSCLEVVCHLSDFEIVYADRLKRVLAEDRPSFFGGDPDLFAHRLQYHARDLANELQLIETQRRQISSILSHATLADFDREGIHSADGPLTLRVLLRRVTGHIPHHLTFLQAKRAALQASPR